MPFLRRGFLKAANRPNNLYCRIDASPGAAIFFAFLFMFLGNIGVPDVPLRAVADRAVAPHAHDVSLALREDAIEIAVTRDGTIFFRNCRVHPNELPNRIRDAILNGAEKKVYLVVDTRARYGDVKSVLPQIQLAGVEKVCFLTE